jgi:muconolactone delta-isomerase
MSTVAAGWCRDAARGLVMQYLCLSKRLPDADLEAFKALAVAETRAAWNLYRDGVFQNLYFDAAKSKGMIVLAAASEAEVRAHLEKLPMRAARLIDFDVYAMGPYTRIEELFAKPVP